MRDDGKCQRVRKNAVAAGAGKKDCRAKEAGGKENKYASLSTIIQGGCTSLSGRHEKTRASTRKKRGKGGEKKEKEERGGKGKKEGWKGLEAAKKHRVQEEKKVPCRGKNPRSREKEMGILQSGKERKNGINPNLRATARETKKTSFSGKVKRGRRRGCVKKRRRKVHRGVGKEG